jgi:hypothetical protein
MAQVLQHYRRTVTFLFPNGAAGATLIQSEGLPFTGQINHIRQVNINATNPVTAQLEIVDSHGVAIFDGTAKAEAASHDHEFVATPRILDGEDTLRCTLSGDPGATGYKVDAVISCFGRP